MFGQSTTEALRTLTAELQAIARGERDLSTRVAVSGPAAVAACAEAVNALLDSVRGVVSYARDSGGQVASSVATLTTSSRELEATMTEQAASTSQVIASVRAISSTARQLASTMGEVTTLSTAAALSADAGHAGLQRMSDTMRQMEESSRAISEKLEVINGRAGNITGVVTTIAKIADQTNLLSLNAAIEAAKAGEAGEGFAVVAREIRRLADKTAVATLDIERMVKEMQTAVSSGVMGMEKFTDEARRAVDDVDDVGEQFTHILAQVQALTPRFESVTSGVEAQSRDAAQIDESMTQLGEATRHTADALRETRRVVEQLSAAARRLDGERTRFAAAAAAQG